METAEGTRTCSIFISNMMKHSCLCVKMHIHHTKPHV